jgi:eukaryotic-like serine/threonine-protein kinase
MKKLFIGLCLSIIAILFFVNTIAVASSNPSKTVANDKFILYENETHNFQINHPRKWEVAEGVMGTVVAFISPRENADDKFRENINVAVGDLAAYPGLTLDKYEEISLAQLTNLITDFKLVKRGNSVISGMPAKTLVFTGRQGIFQVKFMQAYMIANNRAYVITFSAENREYRNYEEVTKEMLNSILIK